MMSSIWGLEANLLNIQVRLTIFVQVAESVKPTHIVYNKPSIDELKNKKTRINFSLL